MNNDEITKRMNENIKKPNPKKGKTPPKKGKKGLVVILLLVLIIGGGIAVIGLNLFDLREGTLMPYLRNAPLIGGLFSLADEEDEGITLEDMTPQQLANMIRALERENEALQEQMDDAATRERENNLLIARLRPFSEHWFEYQRVSAEFNAMIARGDPEAFLAHIQYVLPEFYEQLARDSMQLRDFDETIMALVRTLSAMQEKNAAEILVDLRTTDPELLVHILTAMSNALRGSIFDQMESAVAASMLRMISVSEPVLSPVAPALYTPELPEVLEDIDPEYDPDDNGENSDNDENGTADS
jgi:prefoldin subunit 5